MLPVCLLGLALGELYRPRGYGPVVVGIYRGLVHGGLPLLVLLAARSRLADWGIGLGRWRWWLPRLGLALALLIPGVVLALCLDPELARYYPSWRPARSSLAMLAYQQAGIGIDFLGWELLFRGVLLFGIGRRFGWTQGNIAQAIPFFLSHWNKPLLELLTSLPGGLLAGRFCLGARSFLPLFAIHWMQMIVVALTGFALRH